MDVARAYSCEMIVVGTTSFFRWILEIVGDGYPQVAEVAVQHVARCRPKATIWDMKLKAASRVDDEAVH